MGDEEDKSKGKSLCRFGCGFFGSVDTNGLCSVCYKLTSKDGKQKRKAFTKSAVVSSHESVAKTSKNVDATVCNVSQNKVSKLVASPEPVCDPKKPSLTKPEVNAQPAAAIKHSSNSNGDATPSAPVEPGTSQNGTVSNEADKPEKKRIRCAKCGRKVGLTGFECRCGLIFCAAHRYSDMHGCTFNYREMGAEQIRRENPQVVKEKIDKI